ncbi:YbdK family carboxylate-amine ligase [Baekduia soli]|uniref:Putative glutamate--cysteine ligase 2 n=1 Tax=Baekduia soli TaxID=496014 RepID=A0A5B8UAV0_9ACTN|nr:YbdK family carboxylate-amine ligase [Baekduia soli]QEC49741.1 YbdK family carboxylate-amine ligase [Baekduia soli]
MSTGVAARPRAAFDHAEPLTVGMEEEYMLLRPGTWDLLPRADAVLRRLQGDRRFQAEMPAAQLEAVTPPVQTVPAAAAALREARGALADAAGGIGVLASGGVHPFAAGEGALTRGPRYEAIASEYAWAARRQLAFGLHVHVAVAGADVALGVYNALREHLPALAALGAGAPFHEGADSGLASMRPKICDLLPRQGVPPVMPTWDALEAAWRWGAATGTFSATDGWWWELRLHPRYGTVEVRVPDAQATTADASALAAVVHALVATLADRAAAGTLPEPAESWRIAENRWSACRHGVRGRWSDVRTGEVRDTADVLGDLLDDLAPAAARLGCAAELQSARDLVLHPRDALIREVAAEGGARAVAAWLADRFLG